MDLVGGMRGIVLGAAVVVACGGGTEEAGDAPAGEDTTAVQDTAEAVRQARADSVAMAEEQYDPAAFDSIGWDGADERFERGEFVWNFSCRDCHGTQGRGDGPVATRRGYEVPNFNVGEWEYAGNVEEIRHRVYVGHESEMPSWGLYGLTYRDIDAVAYYANAVYGGTAEPNEAGR